MEDFSLTLFGIVNPCRVLIAAKRADCCQRATASAAKVHLIGVVELAIDTFHDAGVLIKWFKALSPDGKKQIGPER
jgi:hypothetical protein